MTRIRETDPTTAATQRGRIREAVAAMTPRERAISLARLELVEAVMTLIPAGQSLPSSAPSAKAFLETLKTRPTTEAHDEQFREFLAKL